MRLRHLLLALAVLCAAPGAWAANYFVRQTGDWNVNATWSTASCTGAAAGATPTSADNVFLCPGNTVTVPCNVNAAAIDITDTGAWTNTTAGGFVMDGSACSAGQVPSLTLHSTSTAASIRLDGQTGTPVTFQATRGQTFRLKGRSIITSAAWGEPSDLTQNCGGSNKLLNKGGATMTTYVAANEDCTLWTWANAPHSTGAPTLTNLTNGDIVIFTSGWYKGNAAHVLASSPTTLTMGFGDPDDMYGRQPAWVGPAALADPSLNQPGHKSLQTYIDVRVEGVDRTNPTRTLVNVSAGALQPIPPAADASGQRAGQCLITYQPVTPAGSYRYYRIAGTMDGTGAGATDQLILDPWETLATADSAAAFVALAENAWIGPCVRPGDSWIAFEPAVVRPATVAANQAALHFLGGQCPDISYAWIAHPTHALDNFTANEVWSGLTSPHVGFFGQQGCTPFTGPTLIGPGRSFAAPFLSSGYAVQIGAAVNTTISNLAIQGYFNTVASSSQNHGIAFYDVQNLVIENNNISFINNDGVYMATQAEESAGASPEADHIGITDLTEWEGATVTVRNNTFHDLIQHTNTTDNGVAIAFQTNQTVGEFSLLAHGNTAWQIDAGGMSFPTTTPSVTQTISVVNNVFGAMARQQGSPSVSNTEQVKCNNPGNDAVVVNNILLSNPDYNTSSTFDTQGLVECRTALYNYVGENAFAIKITTDDGFPSAITLSGNLLEGAGATTLLAGGAAPVLSTSARRGFFHQRNGTAYTGTLSVENNVLRRWCGMFTTTGTVGFFAQGAGTGVMTTLLRNNAFGLWCPEITGVGNTPQGSGSGAVVFSNAASASNYTAASRISNNLIVNGDPLYDATDNFNTYPVFFSANPTAASFTVTNNFCSENSSNGNPLGTFPCCMTGATCGDADITKDTTTGPSVGLEFYTPFRPMRALGIRSETDLRLADESPLNYGTGAHAGAGYAGIMFWADTFDNLGLPQAWFHQRGAPTDEPIDSLIPSRVLRFVTDETLDDPIFQPGIFQ